MTVLFKRFRIESRCK